jgi:hypothetical protein
MTTIGGDSPFTTGAWAEQRTILEGGRRA